MQVETPLRRKGNILVKMEALQPGSSHKARASRHIIRRAIENGDLCPGGPRRILEKSGGNLGVGLAFEAARHGIGVDLVIGLSFSRIKRAMCERYGARVICDDLLRAGMSPKEVVLKLAEEQPERYFFTDQFSNEANLAAHLAETGPEVTAQLRPLLRKGQPLILVLGAGTGASFQGISTVLKDAFDNVSCHLVMPEGCDLATNSFCDHPLEGFAVGVRPPFLDLALVDDIHQIDGAGARAGQARMATDIGFFPGMTSGANYAVAHRLGAAHPDALILTLAYDSGEAYLPCGCPAAPIDMKEPAHA